MNELFNNFYNIIIGAINTLGIYGPLLGCFFIILESIIPPLPLFVFITINFVAFGKILGFLISWICTCIGCMLSYSLIKRIFKEKIERKVKNIDSLNKCINYIKSLSLVQITVIMSIPFTPAFMMNIAAGIVGIESKKFLISVLISKVFLVYFWGIIGTGLLDSLQNPKSILQVFCMLIIAYILSMIIKKVFKIN